MSLLKLYYRISPVCSVTNFVCFSLIIGEFYLSFKKRFYFLLAIKVIIKSIRRFLKHVELLYQI